MKFRKLAKQIFKIFIRYSLVTAITLCLFEGTFRLYLIDFYKSSFEYLNSDFVDRNTDRTLMIISDSFSTFKGGYPKVLHDSLPRFSVKNISVPGTCIREQYLFGKHHINETNPDVLLYQFYVGNDLFGWNHHVNWNEVSTIRNIYWKLSENLLSSTYINFSLGSYIFNNTTNETAPSQQAKEFSPEFYTSRDKLYFKSEPMLIENSAYLKNKRDYDLEEYMNKMQQLFSYVKSEAEIYILLIPHSSQVTERYKLQAEQLGALFSNEFKSGGEHYPLAERMSDYFKRDSRIKVLNPINHLFSKEESDEHLFYVNDSHSNQQGQEEIGKFLLSQIQHQ